MSALRLADLMDVASVAEATADGLVRVQTSGHHPYRILNYTEKAVYSKTWTPVTTQCRGLIVDTDDTVVARPFRKFFNYGEHIADTLDLTAPVEVTDKLDGSLGILYRYPDGRPAIATRGSFGSDQADHATLLYRAKYEGAWLPGTDFTFLFEIVYPENRIVLDYGTTDDLILLGCVEIATGRVFGPTAVECSGWPGPRATVYDYPTLADALAADPRPNAEGLVVRYLDGAHTGTMVKIKQDDYVYLHRIVTGLTSRRLWERAAIHDVLAMHPDTTVKQLGQAFRMDAAEVRAIIDAGTGWADEIRQTAPEEFTDWIDATIAALGNEVREVCSLVEGEALGWGGHSRKDVALGIADHPFRGLVFAQLDGKPWRAQAWAAIRPEAERPFAARGEDVA